MIAPAPTPPIDPPPVREVLRRAARRGALAAGIGAAFGGAVGLGTVGLLEGAALGLVAGGVPAAVTAPVEARLRDRPLTAGLVTFAGSAALLVVLAAQGVCARGVQAGGLAGGLAALDPTLAMRGHFERLLAGGIVGLSLAAGVGMGAVVTQRARGASTTDVVVRASLTTAALMLLIFAGVVVAQATAGSVPLDAVGFGVLLGAVNGAAATAAALVPLWSLTLAGLDHIEDRRREPPAGRPC